MAITTIADLHEVIRARHPRSLDHHEDNRRYFPRGINHDVRFYEPFPITATKGDGPYITDADGHELIDLWMGHFAGILGHANPIIVDAVAQASRNALHPGMPTELQAEYGAALARAVPELELMRLCTSGTEATMYASRVARAFTGKPVVAKIQGGWHGGNTDLSHAVKPPYASPSTNGIGPCPCEETIALPFNNMTDTLDALHARKSDIAAIIVEPMLGSAGMIPARTEYLEALRGFCDETGALLIFDEIITGFRFRFGSAWPLFGVKPDLFTFGKIAGGGMPMGIYGGREDVMRVIEQKKIIVGGGTFSAHPACLAAGLAALTLLRRADYAGLNAAGEQLADDVRDLITERGVNAFVSGMGSMFALHFTTGTLPEELDRPSLMQGITDPSADGVFRLLMQLENVFAVHGAGAIGFAHIAKHLHDDLIAAFSRALDRFPEIVR